MDWLFGCFHCFDCNEDKRLSGGDQDNDSIFRGKGLTSNESLSIRTSGPADCEECTDTDGRARHISGISDCRPVDTNSTTGELSDSMSAFSKEEKVLIMNQQRRRADLASDVGYFNPDLYTKQGTVVAAGNTSEDVHKNVGQIEIRLDYDKDRSDFIVTVLKLSNLVPKRTRVSISHTIFAPCIRVTVDPPVDTRHRIFKSKQKSRDQMIGYTFKFPMTYQQISERSLKFEVLDGTARVPFNNIVGEAVLELHGLEICAGVEASLGLKRYFQNYTAGEIQCQLAYLPAAERLAVTIMQARNLRKMDIIGSSDPYVIISLHINGRLNKKQKTTVIRRTLEPKWYEQFHFYMNDRMLKAASLELTVMDKDYIGSSDIIGWLRICSSPMDPSISTNTQTPTCPAASRFWTDLLHSKSTSSVWLPLTFEAPSDDK